MVPVRARRARHPDPAAVRDYIDQVLPAKPDEQAVLGVDTVEMPVMAMFDD